MRELERRIEAWRGSMRAKLGPETVEELENNLRESIDEFLKSGRSEGEAFELAVKRLGSARDICAQFDLAQENWWAFKAAKIGAIVVTAVALAASATIAAQSGPTKWLLAAHVLTITTGYIGAFIVGALGICFITQRLWHDFSPSANARAAQVVVTFARIAAVLTAAGNVLAVIWAKLEWGRYWAWEYREIGGVAILGWLLVFVALSRVKTMPTRALMMLTLLGNIVVVFGWFAAGVWDGRPWIGGQPVVLWSATVLNVFFFVMGLLPAGSLRALKPTQT